MFWDANVYNKIAMVLPNNTKRQLLKPLIVSQLRSLAGPTALDIEDRRTHYSLVEALADGGESTSVFLRARSALCGWRRV